MTFGSTKKPPAWLTQVAFLHEKDVADGLFLWMRFQDERQVDLMARYAWESPGDTELAGCTLRVVIERNAIVAVLDGQDIGSAFGSDQTGKKINLADISFPVILDGGTPPPSPPPPLRFVIAPHLQDSPVHLHTRKGRG